MGLISHWRASSFTIASQRTLNYRLIEKLFSNTLQPKGH